jgi:hypothetical protein
MHEAGSKQSSACHLLLAYLVLVIILDPEDGDDIFLRKIA